MKNDGIMYKPYTNRTTKFENEPHELVSVTILYSFILNLLSFCNNQPNE